MSRIDVIAVYLRMTGCVGQAWMLYLSYLEYALISMFFVAGCLSLVHLSTHPTADVLSIQSYDILWLVIVFGLLFCIPMRLYHRSDICDLDRFAKTAGIPDSYRSIIQTITIYHMVASNLFVVSSALYTVLVDSVQMGDPFTFPFIDVFPDTTANQYVYLCKYVLYALPTYIVHLEVCFVNTTFIYSVGVVKRHFEIIAEHLEMAITDDDEQKLKIAIKHHQEILKYIKTMKTVYTKPITMSLTCFALNLGLMSCLTIEAIQGNIHRTILGLSVFSSVVEFSISTIYCIYGSKMSGLHDDILFIFLRHRLHCLDKSFKKTSLIMITRITLPLEFTVGYVFTINLNLLLKVMKLTYSVLNVLLASLKRRTLTE